MQRLGESASLATASNKNAYLKGQLRFPQIPDSHYGAPEDEIERDLCLKLVLQQVAIFIDLLQLIAILEVGHIHTSWQMDGHT